MVVKMKIMASRGNQQLNVGFEPQWGPGISHIHKAEISEAGLKLGTFCMEGQQLTPGPQGLLMMAVSVMIRIMYVLTLKANYIFMVDCVISMNMRQLCEYSKIWHS
jgi:hypothetical protein